MAQCRSTCFACKIRFKLGRASYFQLLPVSVDITELHEPSGLTLRQVPVFCFTLVISGLPFNRHDTKEKRDFDGLGQ